MNSGPVPTSLKRMSALLRALAHAAGEGTHDLTVVYFFADGPAAHSCDLKGPVLDETGQCADLARVAALLFHTALSDSIAVMILRTPLANGGTALKAWRVRDLVAHPLTAAQSFDAYCIGPDGDLTGPEPGTEYHDAPTLTPTIPAPRQGH